MLQRISSIKPLPDYCLSVSFDDGRKVIYAMRLPRPEGRRRYGAQIFDFNAPSRALRSLCVKEDMHLPGYEQLRDVAGLFQQVQLDKSRTCVYWNDEIDLPSDILYEYGKSV